MLVTTKAIYHTGCLGQSFSNSNMHLDCLEMIVKKIDSDSTGLERGPILHF